MKKIAWIVPLLLACGLSLHQFLSNSQANEEVSNKPMDQEIRKSVVAGTWYPGDRDELNQEIERYLNNCEKMKIPGKILTTMAPHAGYAYSGQIAACAYKQVEGNEYDAVIVLAPSHREAFKGASVYNKDGYQTPLGTVPIHNEIAAKIIEYDDTIKDSYEGHREEHSLEIQLPFLQKAIPDLKIVPIAIWDYSLENCKLVSKAIVNAVKGKNILLAVSTDLYHGYSYKECQKMNDRTIGKILAMEPEELCQGFLSQKYQACGAGPIVVAEMVAMKLGADESKLVARTNSGDVTGKRDGYIVGYAAMLLYQSGEDDVINDEDVGVDLGLADNDKQELLNLARKSIQAAVNKKSSPAVSQSSPIMNEYRGAFVTITKQGLLRGCIGYIFPVKPLAQTVQEMAQAAATRDPRFNPVQPDEVDELEIEISVLTPLREIDDISEIEIGKHGIIIEKGRYSGLLLPQVATEYGWDREMFLDHTCKKAGLPENAWKDENTVIKIFSADVFHEEK